MISTEKLRVRLGGDEVLRGVSAVFEGRHLVLGPNGSGKTTLFRVVSGLLPYRGRVEIDGRPLEEVRGAVGLLATNLAEVYSLAPVKALELLHLFSDLAGVDSARALALLEELGVGGELLGKRRLWELSAGTRKAFTTALALAAGARNVLLDEPFEQLDPAKKVRLVNELRACSSVVVVNTHETWVLEVLPDWEVYLAFEGRLYGPVSAWRLENAVVVEGRSDDALLTVETRAGCFSIVEGGGGRTLTELLTLDRVYELLTSASVRESLRGGRG
uniref:ATP-binding cassette domain-containing protein n=1 Tax=Thermofilum pendens TaxID=2269 RepID=A0A7C3SLW7_THEPE